MKKQITALLLALLFLFVTVGCQTGTNPQSSQDEQSSSAVSEEQQTSSDASQEIVHLTCWANMVGSAVGNISSYDEVASLNKWQEVCNIEIEWMHPPVDQGKEQLQLMFVSDDLPDIFFGRTDWMPESEDSYINNDVIVNLLDYVEYMPNFNALLELEDFNLKKDITTAEGNIARFPNVYGYMLPGAEMYVACNEGLQLRQDWLDKLDLETPNTISELYEVLVAVRDGDPNGNGEKDEIPYVVRGLASSHGGLTSLSTAYKVKWDWGLRWDDSDAVCYGPAQPEFKDFIAEMAKWYAEGLIDPDFMSTDEDNHSTKFLGDRAFATWSTATASGISEYNQNSTNPEFNLVAVTALEASNGVRYFHKTLPATVNVAGMYVSTKCENIERAIQAIDYGYSEEGSKLLTVGIGLDEELYEYDADGNPVDAAGEFKAAIEENGWSNSIVKYAVGALNSWFDVQYPALTTVLPNVVEGGGELTAQKTWSDGVSWELSIPKFVTSFMPTDEADEFNTIMTDVETYSQEELVKFIMGKRNIDEWDNYMQAMEEMGLSRATEIYQNAYESYCAR